MKLSIMEEVSIFMAQIVLTNQNFIIIQSAGTRLQMEAIRGAFIKVVAVLLFLRIVLFGIMKIIQETTWRVIIFILQTSM